MAVKIEQVCVNISTLAADNQPERRRKAILRLWESYLPEHFDKFGNWEPIDQVFDLSRRDAILDQWKWPFLAIKKRPRMDASV